MDSRPSAASVRFDCAPPAEGAGIGCSRGEIWSSAEAASRWLASRPLGGAACSEEVYPGFTYSVCSYVVNHKKDLLTTSSFSLFTLLA